MNTTSTIRQLTIALLLASSPALAAPTDVDSIRPLDGRPETRTNPFAIAARNCDSLLAARLSLMQGTGLAPLRDCEGIPMTQSPPLSAYDCTGLSPNECAVLYRNNPPSEYMNGGWSAQNEMWFMPLADDVAGGNLCIDGTRQFIYVDKALEYTCSINGDACQSDGDCAAGTCEANDIESDDWVFYTQGGTNCRDGQDCLDKYAGGEGQMSSLNASFSYNGEGILSDDPRNPFHGHNRVRLRKCTKDGFAGNITRPATPDDARPSGELNSARYEFDLYFHGYRQWLAAFDRLEAGTAPHAEFYGGCQIPSDCNAGDTCVASVNGQAVNMCRATKALPPLSSAQSVLLVGWSGGSIALSHTGDRLADHLAYGPQPLAPNAVVRLVYDAPWIPGLESDTAFALGHANLYQVAPGDIPTAESPLLLPDDEDPAIEMGADAQFSNRGLVPGGPTHEANLNWGNPMDESCLAVHGIDSWHCHERNHLLAHHVTAAVFTRTAQRDGAGVDSPGSRHLHSNEVCVDDPTEMNCYDWVDEQFRRRVFRQGTAFYRHFDSFGEEGPATPARGVFSPDTRGHNGLESEEEFFEVELMKCRVDGTELRRQTLAGALNQWISTGNRVGAIELREGGIGANGYIWMSAASCQSCPSVAPAQTFEANDLIGEWDLSMCQ